MKTRLLSILAILLTVALFTQTTEAQNGARKFALMEHFTNASCPPCATANPFFEAVYEENTSNAHHIAYHTEFPGFDPMHNANPDDVNTRQNYYSIGGVPSVIFAGDQEIYPTDITSSTIAGEQAITSPVRINVQEVTVGNERTAVISVASLEEVPAGDWRLFVAVVEREIDYGTAPGNNGEVRFPNVFRQMLPNIEGESFTSAGVGQTQDFSYTYNLDSEWDADQTYVIAFIQNYTTQDVLNSGSSWDIQLGYEPTITESFVSTTSATEKIVYDGLLTSFYNDVQFIDVTIESEGAPESWKTSVILPFGEVPYFPGGTGFEAEANYEGNIGFAVETTEDRAVADYTIKFKLTTQTNAFTQSYKVTINNGVTDLIINSSAAGEYTDVYRSGLATTAKAAFGAVDQETFVTEYNKGTWESVENIYVNVAWSFPALTEDQTLALTQFLDAGGNVLIAGQDLGWSVNTPVDPTTGQGGRDTELIKQIFYRDYLGADYIDDGGTNNAFLTPITDDEVLGAVPSSPIADVYDGQYYPDQIAPNNENAHAVFAYNNSDRLAGVRMDNGIFKTVYIGIGLEMIEDQDTKDDLLRLAHEWFQGEITGIEFDSAVQQALMQQNYPNPVADNFTTINFNALPTDMTFRLMDVTGKVVLEQAVAKQAHQLTVNTTNLATGTYFYQLLNETGVVDTKKMVVVE